MRFITLVAGIFLTWRLITLVAGVFFVAQALLEVAENVRGEEAGRRHVYFLQAGRLSKPLATAACFLAEKGFK